LGPQTLVSKAGISVRYIPQLQVGESHEFHMSTTLSVINQNKWSFGDSEKTTPVSGSSSTINHTYTHSGVFWLQVQACDSTVNICETAAIPVRVQDPPSNDTIFLTGYALADVNKDLSDMFATFTLGFDYDIEWSKTDSANNVQNGMLEFPCLGVINCKLIF